MGVHTKRKLIGVTDLPISAHDADLLKVENYIGGLVEFITNCHTPMTIALQGDWGTGKTSFINLVLDGLEKHNVKSPYKAYSVTFNTWKYSQFNQQDHLMISFLSYLLSKLLNKELAEIYEEAVEGQESDNKAGKSTLSRRFMRTMYALTTDITKDLITSTVAASMGMPVVGKVDIPIMEQEDTQEPKRSIYEQANALDSSVAIETLKSMFEEAVAEKIRTEQCERIVIFIDDLDRLNPKLAVDLLEVIKLFLDIENCVFVLAVDYAVITKGLKEKGDITGDEALEVEKSQSFFDKMIQVPFRIPTELYQFESFLTDNLKDYIKDPEKATELVGVIQKSVGSNPRAVKRLLNSFYLISCIVKKGNNEEQDENQDDWNMLLLAVLSMSLSYEPLYKYFCLEGADFSILTEQNKEDLQEKFEKENLKFYEKDLTKYILFLAELRKVVFKDHAENDSEEYSEEDNLAIEKLKNAINLSNITNEKEISTRVQMKEISLSEIEEYKNGKGRIERLMFKGINLQEKTIIGQVMEVLGHIMDNHPSYPEKLTDLYAMHDDQNANIKTRLLLPMIRKEHEKNPEKLASAASKFDKEFRKYSTTLTHSVIPGTHLSITTNYAPIDLCKNVLSILKYLKFEEIDEIKIILNY